MPEFRNLPGIVFHKEDGNLIVTETVPGALTLIIGSAPDGPIGRLSLVRDVSESVRSYDPSGTKTGNLIRGLYETALSGSKYNGLFRVGGSPAVLDFLNGWTIHQKNTDAPTVDVNYEFNNGDHILRIYDSETGQLLFNNLTGVDTGAVTVYFTVSKQMITTGTITVGAENNGILMNLVDASIGTLVTLGVGGFQAATNLINIAGDVTARFKAGSVVEIAGAADVDDDTDYIVSYAIVNSGSTEVRVSHKLVGSTWTPVTAAFEGASLVDTTIVTKSRYMTPSIGTSQTYMEKFESLAKAYWELEGAKIDMVVPMGVYVDVPNIYTNEGTLVVPSESDFLGRVYQFERNGELFFMWDTNGDGVANVVPTPYSVGVDGVQAAKLIAGTFLIDTILTSDANPDTDITWNEANFGHQLAAYLHDLSTNDNEAHGMISMRGPLSYSRAGIMSWLGKEPVYNGDGIITVSGTGLLGYKYTVGSAGVAKGFFHTTTGFVNGTKALDEFNAVIDIGRYISIIGLPMLIRGGYDTSSAGYIASGAGVYAGLDMSLEANTAATNKKIKSNVALPFVLPNKYLDLLVGARYVAFSYASDGSVKVIDAPTASLSTSDYARRLTTKIVSAVAETMRSIGEPFIGNLINGEIRNALEEQANVALQRLQELNYLIAGRAEVRATRDMEIKGEAKMRLFLKVPGELRRLIIYLSLSK